MCIICPSWILVCSSLMVKEIGHKISTFQTRISAVSIIRIHWSGFASLDLTVMPISIFNIFIENASVATFHWSKKCGNLCHLLSWPALLQCVYCFSLMKKLVKILPAAGASYAYLFLPRPPGIEVGAPLSCFYYQLRGVCRPYCWTARVSCLWWCFGYILSRKPAGHYFWLPHHQKNVLVDLAVQTDICSIVHMSCFDTASSAFCVTHNAVYQSGQRLVCHFGSFALSFNVHSGVLWCLSTAGEARVTVKVRKSFVPHPSLSKDFFLRLSLKWTDAWWKAAA